MTQPRQLDRVIRSAVVACAMGALIIGVGATPAVASEPQNDVEQIAALVADVAPFQGAIERPLDNGGAGFSSSVATIPQSSAGSVVIAGETDEPLEVSLPTEVTTLDGVATEDGTIVYSSAAGDVDVAAQALESDKVRLQTVIQEPSAAHEFTYEIGNGYTPAEAADGSLWVYRFDDNGELDIYGVGEAWARDATGAAVATHYEVRGNSIVQVVTPSADTVYPVVADPTWEWYNAAYGAGFSKAETRSLANIGAVTGFCAALPGAFGIACAIAGAQWFLQAGLAANANGCVFIATVPAPLAVRWLSSKCR